MKVAVIGGGWNGAHIAWKIAETVQKKQRNDERRLTVTLIERNREICSNGTSGEFGIRLHAGPHYPRSAATRQSCRRGFREFLETYPKLVNDHEYSIYGFGKTDATGNSSKVSLKEFEQVCYESKGAKKIDLKKMGYRNLEAAMNIPEPSIALGPKLRRTLNDRLAANNVKIIYNFEVVKTQKKPNGNIVVTGKKTSYEFNHVIVATGFQALIPSIKSLPFKMDVVYQPCLALRYKDLHPLRKPISFIVMDGWFPCVMPCDHRTADEKTPVDNYIVTHGKWTIMGSFPRVSEAKDQLKKINNDFVLNQIKRRCEEHLVHFWPAFKDKFKYQGWVGTIIAKIRTEREFRGSVVFRDTTKGLIHIVPGKINNIFDVQREAWHLVNNRRVKKEKSYEYVQGGTLDYSHEEIQETLKTNSFITCGLQTFDELSREFANTSSKNHSPVDIGILVFTLLLIQYWAPERVVLYPRITLQIGLILYMLFKNNKSLPSLRSVSCFFFGQRNDLSNQHEKNNGDNHHIIDLISAKRR